MRGYTPHKIPPLNHSHIIIPVPTERYERQRTRNIPEQFANLAYRHLDEPTTLTIVPDRFEHAEQLRLTDHEPVLHVMKQVGGEI